MTQKETPLIFYDDTIQRVVALQLSVSLKGVKK